MVCGLRNLSEILVGWFLLEDRVWRWIGRDYQLSGDFFAHRGISTSTNISYSCGFLGHLETFPPLFSARFAIRLSIVVKEFQLRHISIFLDVASSGLFSWDRDMLKLRDINFNLGPSRHPLSYWQECTLRERSVIYVEVVYTGVQVGTPRNLFSPGIWSFFPDSSLLPFSCGWMFSPGRIGWVSTRVWSFTH